MQLSEVSSSQTQRYFQYYFSKTLQDESSITVKLVWSEFTKRLIEHYELNHVLKSNFTLLKSQIQSLDYIEGDKVQVINLLGRLPTIKTAFATFLLTEFNKGLINESLLLTELLPDQSHHVLIKNKTNNQDIENALNNCSPLFKEMQTLQNDLGAFSSRIPDTKINTITYKVEKIANVSVKKTEQPKVEYLIPLAIIRMASAVAFSTAGLFYALPVFLEVPLFSHFWLLGVVLALSFLRSAVTNLSLIMQQNTKHT